MKVWFEAMLPEIGSDPQAGLEQAGRAGLIPYRRAAIQLA